MRKGLFVSAFVGSLLFGATAFAEGRGEMIREQVLARQSEGFGKQAHGDLERAPREVIQKIDRVSPRGDIVGAERGGFSTVRAGRGEAARNTSASGAVNTPSEIRQMRQVINPMYGAYRISQAQDGTDSYGGDSRVKGAATQGGTAKNHSASGAVNTPAEIRAMRRAINPMYGAYRTSAAPDGTDSYGGDSLVKGSSTQQTTTKNYSASGAVNTPREIAMMKRVINPMSGAYRTSAAADGTDSYGNGTPFVAPKTFDAMRASTTTERAPAKDPSESRR